MQSLPDPFEREPIRFETPTQVVEDRLADLRLLHGFMTCSVDMAMYDGSPVDCWRFINKETGDKLTLSDPSGIQKQFWQAVITLEGDNPQSFELVDKTLTNNKFVFVVDLFGNPFIKLPEDEEYEVFPVKDFVELIDKNIYKVKVDDDMRVLTPNEAIGLDYLLCTPADPAYTQAVVAHRQSSLLSGRDITHLKGSQPLGNNGSYDFVIQLEEEDNPYDDSGFNRIFSMIIGSNNETALFVRPAGSRATLQAIGDYFEYRVSREGVLVRFVMEDSMGIPKPYIGVPSDGVQYLREFFDKAKHYDPDTPKY